MAADRPHGAGGQGELMERYAWPLRVLAIGLALVAVGVWLMPSGFWREFVIVNGALVVGRQIFVLLKRYIEEGER